MTACVIAWGVPAYWAKDLPQPVRQQLWLAHRLRNDLVASWHERTRLVRAIWSAHPHIAEIEARILHLQAQVAELAAQAAAERSQARSRRITTPTTTQLHAIRAELRQATASRRDAIAGVHADCKAELAAAYVAEKTAVRALYRRYCQDGVDGIALYWATYNDVLASHRTACRQVEAARAAGRAATLRYRGFDGGSIAVQLQRAADQPARTPEVLRSERSPWRGVLELADLQRRGSVRLRVAPGRGEHTHVTIPVVVHRPLPDGADIALARLVLRRTAGHLTAAVHLTALLPSRTIDDHPATEPVVAVHLGWRRNDERGAIRVATWRSTQPLPIPDDVADVVTAGPGGRVGSVELPGTWTRQITVAAALRSERDRALDRLRDQLTAHLRAHPPRDDDWPTAAEVSRWKSAGRFAALALRTRTQPPPGREQIVAELEAWRRGDRRRWEPEAHGRARALRRRDDAYRRVAAWLAARAAQIVVDDTTISALARRDPPGPDAAPTARAAASATQRTLSAPGSLRRRIVTTAARDQVPVRHVSHQGLTRTHYRCGHLNPADADYTTSIVTCQGCGHGYDQDLSATLMMLAAAGAAPPPGSDDLHTLR